MASDNLKAGVYGALKQVSSIFDKLTDYELTKKLKTDLMNQETAQQERIARVRGEEQRRTQAESPYNVPVGYDPVTGEPIYKTFEGKTLPSRIQPPTPVGGEQKTEETPAIPKPELNKSEDKQTEILVRNMAQQLPKLKDEARKGLTGLNTVNKAISLVEKGGVTGKKGELKALLAQYSEFSGSDIDNLSEAQTFQLLTRLLVGPVRLDIVGPGPVSEYEQQIMQKVSGGGGASKGAALELLKYYKSLGKNKVDNYNETLSGAVKLNKKFSDIYSPIKIEDNENTKVKTGSADDILRKYGITK